MRKDALDSISYKSDHAHGAALFSVLPGRRDLGLVRLLVAYQTLWDYLDNVTESHPLQGGAHDVHRALTDALDPRERGGPHLLSDGGYLLALVTSCQDACSVLPSYRLVRPLLLDGATQCAIQTVNHDPVRRRRERELKRIAQAVSPRLGTAMRWFEATAAASAYLPHPLLALACEVDVDLETALRTQAAYFPWVSLAIAMLDSYVDQEEDRAESKHSYIAYYGAEALAVARVCEIVRRAIAEVRTLPGGSRHAVLVAAMVAMYLSKTDHDDDNARASVDQLLGAGGTVSRLLIPHLRAWRLLLDVSQARAARARGQLPPGSPLPATIQTFLFWKSPLAYLESGQRRYGKRFSMRATSHPPLVFLSDPADIRAMFAARADVLLPGQGSATIEPLVGESSFMLCEGDGHLATRRALLPAFHRSAVQEHADMVAETAEREIATWPVDVCISLHPRLRALTLRIILDAVFGYSSVGGPTMLLTLRDGLLAMFDVTATTMLAQPLTRRGPGRPAWQRFLRNRARVDEMLYALIEERRGGAPGGNDILARLLAVRDQDGVEMPNRWVRDNLVSIILAGHETTAAELAWAVQLVVHHPRTHSRLVSEIDGDSSDSYLTATVREVLRHRPVFLFAIPRTVAEPIEIGGWTYPLHTQLLACIYLVQHDPKIYPQPHEFQPERFLATGAIGSNWLPWGGGRKRCPGLHLATLEITTVLRTLLASRVVCSVGSRLERPRWRSVIVTPEKGSRVMLSHRKRRA